MKVKVLHSFAGLVYAGAKGTTIDLPLTEARSLKHAGIVDIIEDYVPEMAYETPEEAEKETRIIKPKGRGVQIKNRAKR